MRENSKNASKGIKSNTLLCSNCCVELVEVKFDLEVNGIILHDVVALRCPNCEEESFTPQQYEEIRRRTNRSNQI